MPNDHDILFWPDGFWCFRDEHDSGSLRDYDYRVVEVRSKEWFERTRQPGDPLSV